MFPSTNPVIYLLLLLVLPSARGFRLPPALYPHHYDLALVFHIDPAQDFPYFGLVKIELTAVLPTDKIVLHALSPRYNVSNDAIVVNSTDASLKIRRVRRDDKTGLLSIDVPRTLREGDNVTLTIPFSGHLAQVLNGIYVSSYEDFLNNQTEYLVSTQFEPTHARRGFPCLDEPQLKASFRVSIAHHANYTALANMPLEANPDQHELEEYWPWDTMNKKFKSSRAQFKWSQFAVSPPMSSYLVAFVVSRFARQQAAAGRVPCAVWARRDAIGQTRLAADLCPKIMSYYEQWFDYPYSLPKLDLVAIPGFSTGAMENWGLVTFKEYALLYDSKIASLEFKKVTVDVIAHELAHQWFGNLVTMEWWSDLWLNEGFASFMVMPLQRALFPAWSTDDNIATKMFRLLDFDSKKDSHSVIVPINDPNLIDQIFDSITYSKASLLIRMMNLFLGDDVFKKGLQSYIKKFAYKSTTASDLWYEFSATAREHNPINNEISFEEVMVSWTTQPGFPLLTVTRNYEDQSLNITQTRFLYESASTRQTASWWVPLVVRTEAKNDTAPVAWLKPNEGVSKPLMFEHAAGPEQWLILNDEMTVPCHVNYDLTNWRLVAAALRRAPRSLPALTRAQLFRDAFELAARGDIDYAVPIDLASYFPQETENTPIIIGIMTLQEIHDKIKRSPELEEFEKYARMLITPAYNRAGGVTGEAGDDVTKGQTQLIVVEWACRVEVQNCEDTAVDMFRAWMESENPDDEIPIAAEVRKTVCCAGVRRGGVKQFRFLLQRLRRAPPAAAVDFLAALACARDQYLLQLYLDMTLQGTEIRLQDVPDVVNHISRSPEGFPLAKKFLYSKIQAIYDSFDDITGQRIVGALISGLLSQFTHQKEIDEFIAWRKKHNENLDVIKASVDRSLEEARRGAAWARLRPRLLQLLRAQTESWEEERPALRTPVTTETTPAGSESGADSGSVDGSDGASREPVKKKSALRKSRWRPKRSVAPRPQAESRAALLLCYLHLFIAFD